MKIVIGGLGALGMASLVTGAALWIHSWTIVQHDREIFGFLQESQEKIEAALAIGLNSKIRNILPIGIIHLKDSTGLRCSDLNDYSGATCGFALMFTTLAVIAWRRQKLSDIERETAELAAPIRLNLDDRKTKKEEVTVCVLETRMQQLASNP